LDDATKQQIERGRRVVEVLKQKQYSPVSVAKQVAILYAVNKGHLDDVATDAIAAWEQDLFAFLDASKQDVLEAILGGWGDDVEEKLKSAIEEFKASK
jgi:F-type H+-transporting ATPase subunit alpha